MHTPMWFQPHLRCQRRLTRDSVLFHTAAMDFNQSAIMMSPLPRLQDRSGTARRHQHESAACNSKAT